MPEQLKKEEVTSKTDPSVSKQLDTESSLATKTKDLYEIVDGLKIGILGTYRPGVGPIGRSMAVAKRTGPDFLFLANAHSQKFNDLENGPPEANVSFINSSNQDWVSVTGECVTSDNSDPRIKEVWSKGTKAWFGDLGDGVHTGGPEDPRMKLIEIRAKHITYWKHDVGSLGFMKEITGANLLGGVAVTGTLREITGSELDQARKNDSSMSSWVFLL